MSKRTGKTDLFQTTEDTSTARGAQHQGRPPELEPWQKLTINIYDSQIGALKDLTYKTDIKRSELIRAILGAVLEAGPDLEGCRTEADIRELLKNHLTK